jgi:hypothetical protein
LYTYRKLSNRPKKFKGGLMQGFQVISWQLFLHQQWYLWLVVLARERE